MNQEEKDIAEAEAAMEEEEGSPKKDSYVDKMAISIKTIAANVIRDTIAVQRKSSIDK